MLISLTKAGLQSLFRALFLPSKANDTAWSLPRGNPVLPTDDRAESGGGPLDLPWQRC